MKLRTLITVLTMLGMTAALNAQGFDIVYDQATGNINLANANPLLTTFEAKSAGSNWMGDGRGSFLPPFDIYTPPKAFKLGTAGFADGSPGTPFGAVPTGWSVDDWLADMSVDGSFAGGGGFENATVNYIGFVEAVAAFCDTSAAQVCIDFDSTLPPEGVQSFGTSEIRTDGGNPGGYLSVTDAANGQRGSVIFPDLDGSGVGQLAFGGRTGGANAAHHIDNIEVSVNGAAFSIAADLRVGGGTDRPADGFSFNFARPGDPVLDDGEGYASSPTGEANLPEEGTTTGVAIGFDEWFSGGEDVVGLSLRIDNELVQQWELPTLNGALDDVTSLQTGDRGPGGPGDISALGWAKLEIEFDPANGLVDASGNAARALVNWKGQEYAYVPEPGSITMLVLGGLMSLGVLRRRR